MQHITKRSLLCNFLFISIAAVGQPNRNERFVNDQYNPNNYLIFNPDSTFEYRFAYHLLHDISCGQYKTVGDTIFLSYQTDLRDSVYNQEIDAAANFDSMLFTFRPKQLFYKRNKLYLLNNGKIVYRTEKYQPDRDIPKSSRRYYHRKYWLFGPLVSNTHRTYYMVVESKAKWPKHSN